MRDPRGARLAGIANRDRTRRGQAKAALKILIGIVEDDKRRVLDMFQLNPQAGNNRINLGLTGGRIRLIGRRIVWINF